MVQNKGERIMVQKKTTARRKTARTTTKKTTAKRTIRSARKSSLRSY